MSNEPLDAEQNWNDPTMRGSEEAYHPSREMMDVVAMLEDSLPKIEDPCGIYLALYDLLTEIEEMDLAGKYLVQTGLRVIAGEHRSLTYFLYNQIELFAQLNPEAQRVYEQLADIIGEDEGELGATTLHLDQRKIYLHDLIPELLLARHLLQARVISDAEYHVILHDLCWYDTRPPPAPRTVAYILEDRVLPHHDRAIEFLAHDSGVPYLDLRMIQPDPASLDLLPREFMRVRGACAFGSVGRDPMIAVLNPFNLQLRDDVFKHIEEPTHYFFTSAQGYQKILDLL